MNIPFSTALRRLLALAAACCLLAAAAPAALAAPELDPNTAVNDYAGILTEETEAYVENLSVALQDTCGAQIGVYTTEYIGNSTMEGYAYEVLNTWGLGSADRDNGVLLLLAPGEDDYYVTRGAGLETQLTISMLGTILDEELEPSWLERDYDTGTRQTVRAIAEDLCSIYGIPVSTLDNAAQSAAPPQKAGGSIVTGVLILLVVILVIVLIAGLSRPHRRAPRPRRTASNPLLWFGLGRASRPRRPRRPPPPPPGGPGGFGGPGGPPRQGIFGGVPRPRRAPSRSRPGGGSRSPRPSRPRSGGFRPGGGSGRGGGVGRRG